MLGARGSQKDSTTTVQAVQASAAPGPDPTGRSRPKRSFWGWGLEGEGLGASELGQLGSTFAGRFGIEDIDVRQPPAVEELRLPAPRLEPPPSLQGSFSSDTRERAAHTYGRSFR